MTWPPQREQRGPVTSVGGNHDERTHLGKSVTVLGVQNLNHHARVGALAQRKVGTMTEKTPDARAVAYAQAHHLNLNDLWSLIQHYVEAAK